MWKVYRTGGGAQDCHPGEAIDTVDRHRHDDLIRLVGKCSDAFWQLHVDQDLAGIILAKVY